MLLDLENIKKVFVKNYNKKAKSNKARVPRKRANGGLFDWVHKKGNFIKYCPWCKANGGPHMTHDTV